MISKLLQQFFKHIDSFLMVCLFSTLMVGLFVLYSASGQTFSRVYAQGINIIVAFCFMWVAANIAPNQLERMALPLYLLGVVLLIGVALFGHISHGAQRWLDIGPMHIQPSEIMRIAVPMMLAWYFSKQEGKPRIVDFATGALLLAVPVALIMKQPDLGTSLLVAASGFYILFLAGLNWKFLLGGTVLFTALTPVFWSMLHSYQRRRIEILFDPTQDPLGSGYHTIQSMIAIGSGGSAGKGWLNGTQTQLDFLPERTTDFIFAVFSEEFGFLGNLLLLTLFSLIIMRGLVIASQAQSTFSRLLAGSITLTFFTYAFVNMGMVSGILPVVGVPLPLISYGGTSMVTICLSFGILMSIQTHKKLVAT
ncbi:MAG: rod shape-determining protein RodA [Methylotenera sp.]|uniref:rod shape-determining protein RodA n=1 Tax=Methylotenera sp. TaxID=2051956 RepID=UPI00271E8FE1|nr:rod shape-determining protein RodA [Methylotenera sp.]MDO9205429.1 rod shape-determining protein RodA [Methylotenera sp.]MDO9392379.1 rod shape-determining protein RodA [Methylotenera sp.]MDP1523418.1 rod shape-determining protein RodA [Methylotenera sp.]MDP3307959.1 rod shape-determining protein RodA [Methylotenera sp.]